MTSDHPRTAGRVPVALYICTGDPAAAGLIAAHVRTYAEARQWVVAVLAVDSDPAQPLTTRPGWQAITDALSEHTAAGVVTWTRDMVNDNPTASPSRHADAFARLADVLRERGTFLAAAADPDIPAGAIPPRRSPGDNWRRRELTSSATGLFAARRAAGIATDPRDIGC